MFFNRISANRKMVRLPAKYQNAARRRMMFLEPLEERSLLATLAFAPPVSMPISGIGGGVSDVIVGNYKEDAFPDILVSYNTGSYPSNPEKVAIFNATGPATYPAPTIFNPSPQQWGASLNIADLNGDGHTDFVMTHGGSNALGFGNQISVNLGSGAGGFSESQVFNTGGSLSRFVISSFNSNANATPDIVVPTYDSNTMFFHSGNGNGTFAGGVGAGISPDDLKAYDFNGDGRMDLATIDSNPPQFQLLSGNGNGGFAVTQNNATARGNSLELADVNNDSRMDVVAMDSGNRQLYVLLGQPGGTFAAPIVIPTGISQNLGGKHHLADLNLDGKQDVVFGSPGLGQLYVMLGDGAGNLGAPSIIASAANIGGSVDIADLNQDGKPDIVASYGTPFVSGGVLYLLNQTVNIETTVSVVGGQLVVSDAVSGGKADAIVLSYYSSGGNNYVRVYDPNNILGAGAGANQVDAHTVDVLASTISGNIQVNTLAGNDLLTVDSSMTASGKPIAFNDGDPTSGPPGDSLVISGFGAFTDITHSFSSAANGSVDIDGYAINYKGLEPVTDNLSATNRVFTFIGAAETVTLADDATPGNTMSVISSTLGESVTFANPTGSLTVNLTNDSDTLNFNSLDSKEPSPLGPVVPGLAAGDLVVTDVNGGAGGPVIAPAGTRVIKVNPVSGAQSLISSDGLINGVGNTTLAIDPIGMIVVADPAVGAEPAQIILVNPSTGAQTLLSAGGLLSNPYGVTIDASGNILIAEPTYAVGGATGAIIKIDRITGAQSVAAVGGFINAPADVTMDTAGNMFVAYFNGSPTGVGIVKVAPGGAQTLVSPGSGLPSWTGGIVVNATGRIFTSEIYYYNGIFEINPSTGAQSVFSSGGLFEDPWDLDIEASGNLIVADGELSGVGRIIRVNPVSGAQTSVSLGGLLSDPMDISVMDPIVLSAFSADLTINGDGGDTVNFPSALINLGAGNANLGTTGGQPIQDINFSGGGLTTTSSVFITTVGVITTTTSATDVVADGLTATASGDIGSAANPIETSVNSLTASTDVGGGSQFFNEANGLTDLDLNAGAGDVMLTLSAGAIVDTAADENDITGANLLLKSVGGVGAGANPIEVAVTNADIANSTGGGIFVTDIAGGLILLDSALDADTLSVSGVGGGGLITALSPLTIAASATTSGGMTYTATDGGGAGDSLTINAGVAVTDTTASLTFNAGDDFTLTDTASISAATTATINIDAGNAEVGGATANINGALAAGSGAFLDGDTEGDTFNITGPTVGALDSITAAVTVNGFGGTNTLNISDANDGSGDTAVITHTTVEGLGGSPGTDYTFGNIAILNVTATSVADSVTTTLGGAPGFNGLVNVSVRGNGGNDDMFLHIADSATDATLDFVNLFGDAGGDNFGGAAPADRIRPVLASGQTQIIINGDAEAKLGPGPLNPGTTGTLTATDHLFLDMTTTDSGMAVNPVVIVDTNGGYADSANTKSFRYNGIEDIDLYDGGVLTNTAIGDFYLRATDNADYIQFVGSGQNTVAQSFRARVGNIYYPASGNYGPYTQGVSKIYVYGRGGNDTITMYNTRLNAAFFGEAGDDVLTGGYGDDLLVGGAGNDRLNGAAVGGNDEIWGDDYNPAVDGVSIAAISLASQTGTGNDQVNTFGGADTVYGQGGNDIINTGGGADYINGGPGADQLDGQSGDDRIYGGNGVDVISGSDGIDVVAGNDDNDTLHGRAGHDIVIGGDGVDVVNGNEGSDALVGNDSNGAGSYSLAKGDLADAALIALLTAWSGAPGVLPFGSPPFGSGADDGDRDTLWGGAATDAFFITGFDLAADKNAFGYGPDL